MSFDANLFQIRRWLRACTANHTRCGPGRSHSLPHRVIDVQCFIKSHPVRLRETCRELGQYICLSHCWGKPNIPPPLTTFATYFDRVTGISWSDLLITIQDTIDLARQLSIRYVWIDSLCIIQDDDKDWAEQAGLMASIYSNSYLTVAAAAVKDCHSGLYPTSGYSHRFTKLESSFSGNLYTYRLMPHVNECDYPLLERGWVYQERMLSPRVLYFTDAEMNWECRTKRWCECGGITGRLGDKRRVEKELEKLEKHLRKDDNFECEDDFTVRDTQLTWWIECVQLYICLKLSYSKDIFPALAGLARCTQGTPKDMYLAGL
jgi:hypothetical protein